jgi:Rod binding domain-containing protein
LNGKDVQSLANNPKFDQSLKDYESVYLSQMLSHMSAGVGVDPNFGGGIGEETMKSLLINEYGKLMEARGGIGLAAQMKKQLLAAQEQQSAATPAAAPAVTTPAMQAKDSQ